MSTASTSPSLHPEAVLYPDGRSLPTLPAIEHYAGSEKLMRKAMALQAAARCVFDITLDCEDGAHPGAERDHARLVASLINGADNAFNRIGARIHDITNHAWQTDLDEIVGLSGDRLAYLSLPKARGASDVERALAYVRDLEARWGLECEIPFHVIIETHGALRQVWNIAALPGVETLDFGIMDFVSAHHGALGGDAMRSPRQFEHPVIVRAKTEVVAAALAHGVIPTHNVCTELEDRAVIEGDAYRARNEFGFLRMWSIHPNQLDPILTGMQPSQSDVQEAIEIVSAAQDAGWNPIRHGSRLHDRASFRYYWSTLKRARATGTTLSEDVANRFFDQTLR